MRRSTVLLFAFIAAAILSVHAEDWPKWRGADRDGVWTETGIVSSYTELKSKWRVNISSGYSGPTVADGRVYISDRVISPKQIERVHCFDEATGKPLWTHEYDCTYRDVGYTAGPRAAVQIHKGIAYCLGTM